MLVAVQCTIYASFACCVILNLFLLYIVRRFTSRTMKVFSNLIIMAIFCDIMSSIIMVFMQLTVEAKDGIGFHGSANPWLPFTGQWRCAPIMIFAITNNICFWSVPIQAAYRYIVIVRKRSVPLWCPVAVYALVGFTIASLAFPTAFLSEINSLHLQELQSMEFWRGEDTHALCVIKLFSWPVITYIFGMANLGNMGIMLLVWCNKHLNRTLENAQMHFTAKTKQMHREMTHKLYAQAAVPMFTAIIFMIINVCLFFIPSYYGGLFVALLLPNPWIVVINPLVTLCCIKQYRYVAKAILQGRIAEIKSHMSVNHDTSKVAVVMGNRSVNSTTNLK